MERDSNAFNRFLKYYWRYYRELEKEFLSTARYVEFVEDNFSTYSVEFLKLYQAVCSEIDVVGKMMASKANPAFNSESRNNNIYEWWYEIQDSYYFTFTEEYSDAVKTNVDFQIKLQDVECSFIDSYTVCPWKGFRTEISIARGGRRHHRIVDGYSTPNWWSDYNYVKHKRTFASTGIPSRLNYSKANLKNVSYAFSALYVLEMAFMEAVGTQNDLEAFADYSELFDKKSNMTTEEIENLFQE